MNRQDISRLEKNRGLHLKLGFVIAISMVTLAFNYTIEPPAPYEPEPEEIVYEDAVSVIRTVHQKKPQLPPPEIKISDNIIPEDPEFIEEPEQEPLTVEAQPIENPLPKPVVQPVENPTPVPVIPPEEPKDDLPEIWDMVEHMPLFGECNQAKMDKEQRKQCSAIALVRYMSEHIKYPSIARETGIEGTVVIRFVVDEKGNIASPEIVKEIGGGCGLEALRVVKNMPNWEPGRQRNRKVKVYFNLPVKFKLN